MRKMKDSRIKFVKSIPEDWKILKNKHCFKLEKNIVGESFENHKLLSLTKKGIIYKDINNTFGKTPESYETYQSVKNGQIVMCLFDLDISAVFSGLSNHDGMISPAYKVYNCKKNILNQYASYWFDFCFDGRKYMAYSKSLRYVVNTDDFKDIQIILPPLEEQNKIVKFLNKKITEIDRVIEKTKENIEDYKKYKQSIITKTIDEGLEKNNVKNKQKSWSKTKIKYIADINPKCEKEINKDDEVTYTPMEYIKNGYYIQNTGVWKNNTSSYNTYIENDIVMAKVTPCFENGNIAIMDNLINGIGYGSSELIVFRSKDNIEDKYLFYLLQSDIFKKLCISSMTGTGGLKRVSIDFIKNYVCYIPEKKEQEKIINYLDLKCSEIEKLIQSKENLISELENYKRSLIYEYVTGKKEVKSNKALNNNNSKGIKINCKDNIFAQVILLCKIIEKLNDHNLGRVKAEKALYLIEKDIGFDFKNDYVREAAGPLSESIYKCESVISKKNKWIKVNKVKRHIEYEILSEFSKYNQYYEKYYSGYDKQIENIIGIIKDYSTDKAEMVATLYASWNDFIIKKEKVSDLEIVKDVRENWNDTKKRFDEKKWLIVLEEMKQIGLTPKGNGNLTIIKEQ